MPVCRNKKIIFIHIPKNAGESIEKSLNIYNGNKVENIFGISDSIVLQHLTAIQLKNSYFDNSEWNEYFKFAVIRNPWSKAVSEYNWYLRYGPKIQFFEWVNTLKNRININNAININEVGHNIEQYKYIYDENNQLLIDKIIYFENLNKEFNDLCLNKKWSFKLSNTSDTKSFLNINFQKYYDINSLKIVSDIYQKDINYFNYSEKNTFQGYDITSKKFIIDFDKFPKIEKIKKKKSFFSKFF